MRCTAPGPRGERVGHKTKDGLRSFGKYGSNIFSQNRDPAFVTFFNKIRIPCHGAHAFRTVLNPKP